MKLNIYEQKKKELELLISTSEGVKRIFAKQDLLKLEKAYYESNMLR